MVFPYAHNETSEKEIEKHIPLSIASRTIKYLGINLTKKVKDLYNKTEEVTNIQKYITFFCVHGLEELILLKYIYYPEPSIDSMQSLPQFQWHFS